MKNALEISDNEKQDIPDTPEGRVKELMELSLKQKAAFLPPIGGQFRIGPFIFQVSVTNPSQLRFTANLVDVIIDGVNDGKEKVSEIISPITGKGIVK